MIGWIVVDTNVLVSALLSSREDSATVQVVARMLAGDFIPVYSTAIMEEYRQVLHRAKFGFDPETVRYLLEAIEAFGVWVEPKASGRMLPDVKDLPFYEAVLEKRADDTCLVTGNLKHFPNEPFIVTPRELLAIMDGMRKQE